MSLRRLCASLIGAALLAWPVAAADFSDPTWPCVQRKVERLSLGVMWPHPLADAPIRPEIAEAADELIDTLALRRVDLEAAEALIADFAAARPDLNLDDLGGIFHAVFKRIGGDRTIIIRGIERYSLQQIALSEAIEATRVHMAALMDAASPDFDEVDRLEEKLDWDERVFRDRAQSLTYVCETPVILEQRAYGLAQAFLKHAPR